jgi:hypothetical protein
VAVIPEQSDEFTCGACFLVRHRSQLARTGAGTSYCTGCAGWSRKRGTCVVM